MIIDWLKQNWQYRAIALFLAVFSWYLVAGREKIERWVEVPVELVNIPKDLVVVKGMTSRIEVRVRGTKGPVRSIKEKQLAYTLDLSNLTRGENQIYFQARNIPLTGAVEVIEIRPARITLEVDKYERKEVPVRVAWEGRVDPDYELVKAVSQPGFVSVQGPQEKVEMLQVVPTKTFTLEETGTETVQELVPVEVDPELEVEPSQVIVRLYFKPKTRDIWVKLPIDTRTPEGMDISVNPQELRIHYELPLPFLKKPNWRNELAVQLTVPSDIQAGKHEMKPEIRVPKWGRILETRPEQLDVTIEMEQSRTTSGRAAESTQKEQE